MDYALSCARRVLRVMVVYSSETDDRVGCGVKGDRFRGGGGDGDTHI